jgi:hypothetical protein
MNLVLKLGSCINQGLARTSYASQIPIIFRINSRGLNEIIETIYCNPFRVQFIGFLAFNIPNLKCIGQDKLNIAFQNAEDGIPVTSCGFHSNSLTFMIQEPGFKFQEAILVHAKPFLEFQSSPRYHSGNKKVSVNVCSANYFIFHAHVTHCLIWADVDHLCVHIHIRVLGRIWAYARSWMVF